MRFLKAIPILTVLAITSGIFAQVPGSWETFADVNYTRSIIAHGGKLFVGTKGGVISYTPGHDELTIMTNLDGLGGLDVVL